MVDWPSTLPTLKTASMGAFRRAPFRQPIRSKPEDGPLIQRNRSLTEIISQRIELRMTAAQVKLFWAFWRSDLAMGVQRFNASVLLQGRDAATRVCWLQDPEERPFGNAFVV